jgi:arylsulfatase A-like enzyme
MHSLSRFILSASIAIAAAAHSDAATSGKPNVLVIVADDLGWGELTVQGFAKDIPTPHIDSLAQNGVRFTSGYVSGPYCSPTRAALLTGRYQQRFGHEFNPGPAQAAGTAVGLSLEEKTLADRLKDVGYATGWFGKSHLGYESQFHPQKRGFDEFFGFLGGAHSFLNAGAGARNGILRGTEPVREIDHTTEAFAREANRFIEQKKDAPWFVYLPFNAVHSPLESTPKYLEKFAHLADPKRQKFAAMLSALDDSVGSVLAKLRETGQEENTLIFFISDNGGPTPQITSQNGPLRGFKAQTWEGGIRVPWIFQWKAKVPAGKVDDRPVIQLDIPATALAAAGVEARPEWKLEGVNLVPFLTSEKSGAPHEALYWRFGQQIAIRKGNWKLVKAPGAGAEPLRTQKATTEGAHLYNLSNDIGEKTNLAAQEPEKFKELAAAWDQWNSDNQPAKWLPGKRGPARKNASTDGEPPAAPAAGADAARNPQVANRPFTVSAQIDGAKTDGVLVAQGGKGNGYALLVKEGKLTFLLRSGRTLSAIGAEKALGSGKHRVLAKVYAGGKVTLTVDGDVVGVGEAQGLLKRQPREGLTAKGDGTSPVGEYEAPFAITADVTDVQVTAQ